MKIISGKWVAFIFAGLAIGVLYSVLILANERDQSIHGERALPVVGKTVVDIDMSRLDGETVVFSQFQSKPLVVNFWGTWCKHCRDEMPLLERYNTNYQDQYQMLGINTLDSVEEIEVFIEEYSITFPNVVDTDGKITDFYYVSGFPTTFFIDDQGVLQARHVGALTEKQLQKYLNMIGVILS